MKTFNVVAATIALMCLCSPAANADQFVTIFGAEVKTFVPPPVGHYEPQWYSPPPVPVKHVAAPLPAQTQYDLYFAFNSTRLNERSKRVVAEVAYDVRRYKPANVEVRGYADRAGSATYNMRLSDKRAKAVSAALASKGVAHSIVSTAAYGEGNPAVPTKDGVAMPQNRRVEIKLSN